MESIAVDLHITTRAVVWELLVLLPLISSTAATGSNGNQTLSKSDPTVNQSVKPRKQHTSIPPAPFGPRDLSVFLSVAEVSMDGAERLGSYPHPSLHFLAPAAAAASAASFAAASFSAALRACFSLIACASLRHRTRFDRQHSVGLVTEDLFPRLLCTHLLKRKSVPDKVKEGDRGLFKTRGVRSIEHGSTCHDGCVPTCHSASFLQR